MGNKKVKTGRTGPGTAFTQPQVNTVYDLLNNQTDQNSLQKAGTDLLTTDPTEENLALARNLSVDQGDQFAQGLTRSLVGRGIGDSGLATTALASGQGALNANLINDALQRSFQQKLQARQTGAGLLQAKGSLNDMLANFVQSLVGAGISGQTQNYGARSELQGRQTGLTGGQGLLGTGL